jgi:hypothetical protein
VHNAATYNNFRVSWRTVLMPRARGQLASIHRAAENAAAFLGLWLASDEDAPVQARARLYTEHAALSMFSSD